MSDIAGTKNDGGMVFGSQDLTIKDETGADAVYVAEDFSLTRGSNWTVGRNKVNVPDKQFGVQDVKVGTATLLLSGSTIKLPKQFAEFNATEVGGGTEVLIVAEVGQAYTSGGETKVNIGVREKLGA
jgi:hypothetical protein